MVTKIITIITMITCTLSSEAQKLFSSKLFNHLRKGRKKMQIVWRIKKLGMLQIEPNFHGNKFGPRQYGPYLDDALFQPIAT